MSYQERKEAIRKEINQFDLTDNMFFLVKAYKLIAELLKEEKFPIRKFNEN